MKEDDVGERFGVEEPALRDARAEDEVRDEQGGPARDAAFAAEDPAFYLKPTDGEE